MPVIYHGTPLTPRAALMDICAGRAMCVSFHHPQDLEAVEAISPAIMFRQWRVFILAGRNPRRDGMAGNSRLASILRLAGASPVPSGPVGNHAGCAGRAEPDQRQPVDRVAVWPARRSGLAHGWPYRPAITPVRAARPGVPGVDREDGGFAGLSRTHGGRGSRLRQPLAGFAHAARNGGGLRLSFYKRGQHELSAERVAV